jgi:hypothetical protein
MYLSFLEKTLFSVFQGMHLKVACTGIFCLLLQLLTSNSFTRQGKVLGNYLRVKLKITVTIKNYCCFMNNCDRTNSQRHSVLYVPVFNPLPIMTTVAAKTDEYSDRGGGGGRGECNPTQAVIGLQTNCYKSVHKLLTSCVRTACSLL